jgi:flagellar hook-associated protein 3 FlgL
MATFLDGAFANLFADPAWGNSWSSASDQPITSRIDRTQTVATSVSANETAMRKLAMAYTMISGLGVDQLNDQTRQTVIDKAQSVIGEALNDLTNVQAQVGATEKTIDDANSRMTIQRNLLDDRINTLEGVDPAEAKVKIDTLTTQIEMSYSLTTKLLNLSILNYQ